MMHEDPFLAHEHGGPADAVSAPAPEGTPQRAEDDALRESLAKLSRLGAGQMGLEALLTRVADYAVQAIPGAQGAGLALLENDRQNTTVATAQFVSEIDDIQYGIGEGPCISAAREGSTMVSDSLGGDPRWPRFGGTVARLGVHSVVSLPLITPDGVIGAVNAYACAKNAFDGRAAELGEMFAAPAAITVQSAQVLADAERLVVRLRAALENRAVVDRAVGILISRSGISPTEALERLRQLSQGEHQKLAVIAQTIVEEAARRARVRRSH